MREASSANATCDCWVESGGGTERRVAATGPNMSDTSSMNPSRSSSVGDHARILERLSRSSMRSEAPGVSVPTWTTRGNVGKPTRGVSLGR